MTTCLDLEHELDQVRFRQEAHLRECGWVHSSSHPDGMWLFTKTLRCNHKKDGSFEERSYSLPFVHAWSIQRGIEASEDADKQVAECEP